MIPYSYLYNQTRDGRIDPKVSILSILMLYRKDRSSHKNIDSKVHFFNHYFYLLKNSVHKISFYCNGKIDYVSEQLCWIELFLLLIGTHANAERQK